MEQDPAQSVASPTREEVPTATPPPSSAAEEGVRAPSPTHEESRSVNQ